MKLFKSITLLEVLRIFCSFIFWLGRRFFEAGLFSSALVCLFIFAASWSVGWRDTIQQMAFISQNDFLSGVALLVRGFQSVFFVFFAVSCFFAIPYKKSEALLAKLYDRFLGQRFKNLKQSAPGLFSWFEYPKLWLPIGVCALLVAVFANLYFPASDNSSANVSWPPSRDVKNPSEQKAGVRMILPDGRIIVGQGYAMINKNVVEVTFQEPVTPYK